MYNEQNSLNRLFLFMKFTLHSVHVHCTWYIEEIAMLHHLFSATQILQPTVVSKLHRKLQKCIVFKNVSKLEDLTGISSRKNLMP